MTALVMIFAIVLGSVLQAFLPSPAWLGYAQVPIMPGIVIYYAMIADRPTMLMAAGLSGLVEDTLGLMPLGYLSFCYCVTGLICQSFRDMMMARQWTTHVFFGAVTNFSITLFCYLLLAKDDLVHLGFALLGIRLVGSALTGAVAVPLVFHLLERLDRALGNVEWEEA